MRRCKELNAKIQVENFLGMKGDFIEATEEDCKGADDFAVMKEQAGFDSSIWNFVKGKYPTLIDIANIK